MLKKNFFFLFNIQILRAFLSTAAKKVFTLSLMQINFYYHKQFGLFSFIELFAQPQQKLITS